MNICLCSLILLSLRTVKLTQITFTQISRPSQANQADTAPVYIQSQFGTILNQRYLQKTRPRAARNMPGTGTRYRNSNFWFGRLRDKVLNEGLGRDNVESKLDYQKTKTDNNDDTREVFTDEKIENTPNNEEKHKSSEVTSNEEPLIKETVSTSKDLTAVKPSPKTQMKHNQFNLIYNVDLLTVINTDDLEVIKNIREQETNGVRRKRKILFFPTWCDKNHPLGAWLRYAKVETTCKG